MAARLSVIISQSTMRHSRLADQEEQLLTQIMFTPGLDAMLIGPLASVQPDSTDWLCLSGLAHSVAVVSELSHQAVEEHWRRLQLDGQVVSAGDVPAAAGRRIHHLPLELGTAAILAQLKQLLADRAVQTVPLSLAPVAGLARKPSSPLADDTAGLVSLKPPASSGASGNLPAAASPAISPSPAALPAATRQPGDAQPLENHEPWPELDRLVDDLDALEL